MGQESTVIHYNPRLAQQVRYAKAFQAGFSSLGDSVVITDNINQPGNTHVTLGPWYAKKRWEGHSSHLHLDRAYWGDPDCVSLHWLDSGLKRFVFNNTTKRPYPRLKKQKTGSRSIYLAGYAEHVDQPVDKIRRHPSEQRPTMDLEAELSEFDVAYGSNSTALVAALVQGLHVVTRSQNSPVYGITNRKQRMNDLAHHNWSFDEIQSGEALSWIKLQK